MLFWMKWWRGEWILLVVFGMGMRTWISAILNRSMSIGRLMEWNVSDGIEWISEKLVVGMNECL